MEQLSFSNNLPPGARTLKDRGQPAHGISKAEVEESLRAHPNQWALVYEVTTPKTATDWRKKPGFEVAQQNVELEESGPRRIKIWLRYVGGGETEYKPQAADAESLPTQAMSEQQAKTPPAPLSANTAPPPAPPAPPPKTAFQQAWAETPPESSEIVG